MKSALMAREGAVAENENATVAWHYGDPLGEQRLLATTGAVVDRGNRDIIRLTGEERLSWLHSLTSQHLSLLGPGQGTELLVLSPNGHIEHHAGVFDDGTHTWLDTDAGAAAALSEFLLKMRFFTQVDIDDVSAEFALVSVTGDVDLAAPDALPIPGPKFATGTLPGRPSVVYAGDAAAGVWRRRTDALGFATTDILLRRAELSEFIDGTGLPTAGAWAYEALRIPARLARVGVDTDHKTIPHEVPSLLQRAVHLDKGCYRGQETVARVHNLGKPPRQLVMLHLDGSSEHPPAPDTEVTGNDRVVGRIGTAARHYEDGIIALALVRRNIAGKPDARLLVEDSAAAVST